jgi:hypothetical protein
MLINPKEPSRGGFVHPALMGRFIADVVPLGLEEEAEQPVIEPANAGAE